MGKKKVKNDAYRHSLLTDDLEHCYFCGRSPVQMHHVLGADRRDAATNDDLFIPVCWGCHTKIHTEPSQRTNYLLKRRGQRAYEEIHGHDAWMKTYGKNYL